MTRPIQRVLQRGDMLSSLWFHQTSIEASSLAQGLTDRIARDPNGARKVWYLNRFLRTADDVEESLHDSQSGLKNR